MAEAEEAEEAEEAGEAEEGHGVSWCSSYTCFGGFLSRGHEGVNCLFFLFLLLIIIIRCSVKQPKERNQTPVQSLSSFTSIKPNSLERSSDRLSWILMN